MEENATFVNVNDARVTVGKHQGRETFGNYFITKKI